MDNKQFVFLAVVLGVVFLGFVGVGMYFSYSNQEIQLRNSIVAQQKVNEAVFDNTWKIISQQAQIAEQYKEGFKQIYAALMEGRYGNARGGALLSFIQESNPQFDIRLFEKVSSSVEAQRGIFTREQAKLIDLKREHDNLRMLFPGSIFVGDRPEVKIVIVTSGKTEETFRTGKEDDVKLFDSK